jgi:hypothetical protein
MHANGARRALRAAGRIRLPRRRAVWTGASVLAAAMVTAGAMAATSASAASQSHTAAQGSLSISK